MSSFKILAMAGKVLRQEWLLRPQLPKRWEMTSTTANVLYSVAIVAVKGN